MPVNDPPCAGRPSDCKKSVWKKPDVPMRKVPRTNGLRRWERTVLEHVRLNPQPEMRLVAMVLWETRRDIVDGAGGKSRDEALTWVATRGSGWWTFDDLCVECDVDPDVVRQDLLTREPRVRSA